MSTRPARVLVPLLFLGAAGCGSGETTAGPAAAPPPVPVKVMQATSSDRPVDFEFVGKTASTRRVEIRSRVDGFIEERSYEEGSVVEEGQLMFTMDRKPFEAALKAAQAEHAQQVAREETAKANLDRIRPLAEKDAVPLKELDDAEGSWRAAKAAVEAAAAKVVNAELELSYCEIRSPVTGVSSYAEQEEGAYVGLGTGSLLTYVARIDPIYVEFSMSENQVLRARAGAEAGTLALPDEGDFVAELVLADGTVFPAPGRITFADASLSERTGTFLMRAEFPNEDQRLRPGQFVRLWLKGAVRPDAVAVPRRAVMHGAQGAFVWLVDAAGKAEFRPVVTGSWDGDDWVIESGLEGGETVVVEGGMRLRPGATVQVAG